MKWKEFKIQVDKKLEELGKDDIEIHYIDIGVMFYSDGINIVIDNDGLTIN